MRQPDNLPAFCRVHRNGRPLRQNRMSLNCAASLHHPKEAEYAVSASQLPASPLDLQLTIRQPSA